MKSPVASLLVSLTQSRDLGMIFVEVVYLDFMSSLGLKSEEQLKELSVSCKFVGRQLISRYTHGFLLSGKSPPK